MKTLNCRMAPLFARTRGLLSNWFHGWTRVDAFFAVLILIVWSDPAAAQLATVTSTVTMVCQTVKTAGGGVFFIALCWAGYEMSYGKHDWGKTVKVLAGGTLLGAAGPVASAIGVTGTSC